MNRYVPLKFRLAFVLLLVAFMSAPAADGPIREPAVANRFYPGSGPMLKALVDNYLKGANPPAVPGPIQALIVPHAGYQFSGHVAACAYQNLGRQKIETVILIGASHHERFEGASIYPKGAFRTPLGDVEINAALAGKIMAANPPIRYFPPAHDREHSLEVQLPFLQRTLKEFTIVPILIGNDSPKVPTMLAAALKGCLDDRTLVIASSDMSHYPTGDNAKRADNEVIKAILTGSVLKLDQTLTRLRSERIPNAETFLCGEPAVKTVMLMANAIGAKDITLLKYANSGDVSGDQDQVVGYSAIAFGGGASSGAKSGNVPPGTEGSLNRNDQTILLKLARQTVETCVKTGHAPSFENSSPGLAQPLGAFVTLRKQGALRGCIGRFQPSLPLHKVVMEMAISAATRDPRFRPVTEAELKNLSIEISVLSPLQRVKDWRAIQVGKHGVQVTSGYRSGVFLPQVATENNWDLDTFMGELCENKAGLPRYAWKDPATELYVFTAQVFGEKE